MNQEQIDYSDIIDLGFKTEPQSDSVYFNQYGYEYCLFTFKLTSLIYIDWAQESRTCQMIRIDHTKTMNIMKRMPIMNLDHLKQIIDFFTNNKPGYDYSQMC
jgi:hypothetical protein